jgi:serine/threonine protein kinase
LGRAPSPLWLSYFYCVHVLHAGEKFNFCAILDDYRIAEKIGEGGFGYVHLATHKEDNKQFAVKFMDMTQTRK